MKHIELSRGQVTVVDDADYVWLSPLAWFASPTLTQWYARTNVRLDSGRATTRTMHRMILEPTKGLQIDHIDGDGLNNTRSNLRLVTQSQNLQNMRVVRKHTSRYKGVYQPKGETKWFVAIRTGGRQIYLGRFAIEEEAAEAYNASALEHFGEFARLNDVSGEPPRIDLTIEDGDSE